MAKFLTTTQASAHLEEIITKAKEFIFLVSPYLKISQNLLERLIDADRRKVAIHIIYGKEELSVEQRSNLLKIEGLNLYFMQNLHAKCYYNENSMVITSMNIYEFSERNNREMGIAISKVMDVDLYEDAKNEVQSIIVHSRSKKEYNTTTNPIDRSKKKSFRNANYKNWKELVHQSLEQTFNTKVYFYDYKYTLEFKNGNHTINCGIEGLNGKNKFVVSKILTNKKYSELTQRKILVNNNCLFSLDAGGNGRYAMAHLELQANLKTEALNFVYAEDLEVICNTILDFAILAETWK